MNPREKAIVSSKKNSRMSSVLGSDSDLICRNCKKNKKQRMSSYCPGCKTENDKKYR